MAAKRKSKKRKPAIDELIEVMARLRAPGGCPWDREQDHKSIRFHAVEEVYELIDAIEAEDDHEMLEECGDLLLQVVFHCQLAKERKAFDFEKAARTITDKLIRRHPHVFGLRRRQRRCRGLSGRKSSVRKNRAPNTNADPCWMASRAICPRCSAPRNSSKSAQNKLADKPLANRQATIHQGHPRTGVVRTRRIRPTQRLASGSPPPRRNQPTGKSPPQKGNPLGQVASFNPERVKQNYLIHTSYRRTFA